jgi:hypothetical protein
LASVLLGDISNGSNDSTDIRLSLDGATCVQSMVSLTAPAKHDEQAKFPEQAQIL